MAVETGLLEYTKTKPFATKVSTRRPGGKKNPPRLNPDRTIMRNVIFLLGILLML